MLNLKVKYEELKDFMKRKTAVFLLPLFFVSSVVAISTVNNGEQVTIVGDFEQYEAAETPAQQVDDAEESTDIVEPILVAGSSENDSNYVTDSSVVLVETKEDQQRLKVQEKQIKRGTQKQLTADLNKQVKQALEQQIASEGKPLKFTDSQDAVILTVAGSKLSLQTSLQTSKPTKLAMLTTKPQIEQQRKISKKSPPIPPGTFGGGNGNGGPGAGVSAKTASSN